ncbi:MAG: bifunctional metallophosphatase/5'-nucleotidase [Lacipirellulaceae bacterium]
MKLNPILAAVVAAAFAPAASAQLTSLTIFHNNDGESRLLGDANFGGVAHFVSTLNGLRTAQAGRDQLTISSGDNFLAGAAFNASLNSGPAGSRTFFDAQALAAIQYDAITLGNHDFDFGPAVLREFIDSYATSGGTAPFLSANLNFAPEASLAPLVGTRLAKSTIVTRGAERYGIVGATTTDLPVISTPGLVGVNPVLPAVQAEVDALLAQGVNKIVLSSHLQSFNNEIALVGQLRGVDVVIAGGGDELLINSPNARNTLAQRDGPYPVTVADADGKNVAVVTTVGEYFYVGQLNIDFDTAGDVVNVSGDAHLVSKAAVVADPTVQSTIVTPLTSAIAANNALRIGATDVYLEHNAGNPGGPRVIRRRETNLGNLVADAFVWAVDNEARGLTPGNTLIALTNSGGIRDNLDDNVDGLITQGEAIGVLPFANTTAVIGDVNATTLAAMLEHSVSAVENDNGRFAQIAGVSFTYDNTLAPGARVLEIRLADGSPIWSRGLGSQFTGLFDVATNSFVAGGGDGYGPSIAGRPVTVLTTNYSDALIGYLTTSAAGGGLAGVVTAAQYPLSGEGRIVAVPEPAAAVLAMFLAAGFAGARRC